MKQLFSAIIAGFIVILATTTASAVQLYAGDRVRVGDGQAWTWVMVDNRGTPMSMGVSLTEVALTGLPDVDTEYILPLPRQSAATGYKEIALDWNPIGHIPPGIYDRDHFDFHFYLISASERDRITMLGDDIVRLERAPPQQYAPRDYIAAPGGGKPRMGMHWVDLSSHEFHGQPFNSTFIYGFYDGRMVFVEPMVTLDFLAGRTNVLYDVKQPPGFETRGYYPTTYGVRYDPEQRMHTVYLGALIRR